MKLSTKGRYGLKAMFDLALHYDGEPVSLTQISERQNITVNYLEQLIAPLRKAGLVKSTRGAQGGYMLNRCPGKITVGEILETLEGTLAPTDCVTGLGDEECTKADYCVTKMIYEKIKKSINDVVYSITLKDMVDDHMSLQIKQLDPDKYFEKGES